VAVRSTPFLNAPMKHYCQVIQLETEIIKSGTKSYPGSQKAHAHTENTVSFPGLLTGKCSCMHLRGSNGIVSPAPVSWTRCQISACLLLILKTPKALGLYLTEENRGGRGCFCRFIFRAAEDG
jgi:hypothetical protein